MEEWGVSDTMEAKAFVTLGYHAGDYPMGKPRKKCRNIVIEQPHAIAGVNTNNT